MYTYRVFVLVRNDSLNINNKAKSVRYYDKSMYFFTAILLLQRQLEKIDLGIHLPPTKMSIKKKIKTLQYKKSLKLRNTINI